MGPQLADMIAQGDVRLEIRHFPLQPASIWAVEAVECAGDQGYWWAMHHQIFVNQVKGVSTQLMKEHAKALGLDTKAFNQCIDGDKYVAFAKEKQAEAQKAGIRGTPTFFVNGTQVASYLEVVDAVQKELGK